MDAKKPPRRLDPLTIDEAILNSPIDPMTKCLLLGLVRLQAADMPRPVPFVLAPGPKGVQ
jgi:hypothetical protein